VVDDDDEFVVVHGEVDASALAECLGFVDLDVQCCLAA
jgi:hypothetical protein